MPSSISENAIPMVDYSLSQPIHSRILNYKKFVSQLDLDAFNNDNNIIPCHCSQYDHTFLNNEQGHILTGNLKIITNNKLRKLVSKGPKFREPQEIDLDVAKDIVTEGIDTFIKTL